MLRVEPYINGHFLKKTINIMFNTMRKNLYAHIKSPKLESLSRLSEFISMKSKQQTHRKKPTH